MNISVRLCLRSGQRYNHQKKYTVTMHPKILSTAIGRICFATQWQCSGRNMIQRHNNKAIWSLCFLLFFYDNRLYLTGPCLSPFWKFDLKLSVTDRVNPTFSDFQ